MKNLILFLTISFALFSFITNKIEIGELPSKYRADTAGAEYYLADENKLILSNVSIDGKEVIFMNINNKIERFERLNNQKDFSDCFINKRYKIIIIEIPDNNSSKESNETLEEEIPSEWQIKAIMKIIDKKSDDSISVIVNGIFFH